MEQNISPDSRTLRLLRQSFLLAGTGPEAAEQLLAAGSWSRVGFAKGQLIYGADHWQDHLGLLLFGQATAYSAETVSAAILRLFQPGDVFGAAALYLRDAEAFSHIVAAKPCQVLFIESRSIQLFLAANARAAENYIRFLAHRVAFLNRRISALTAGAAKDRLAAHLAAQAQPDAAGRAVFTANLSLLAQSLNISRASLYRSLDRLVELGAIERQGQQISVLDFALLREAGEPPHNDTGPA